MWVKSLNRHNTHAARASTARTQGLPAFSPQCLARHSATDARQERDGGRGGQGKSVTRGGNKEGRMTDRERANED